MKTMKKIIIMMALTTLVSVNFAFATNCTATNQGERSAKVKVDADGNPIADTSAAAGESN